MCNVATTLAATGHPNVITLLDVLEDQSHFYLVLPYLRNGDLFDYMKGYGKGGIPVSEALSFFSQVRRVKTWQDIRHTCTTSTTSTTIATIATAPPPDGSRIALHEAAGSGSP